MSTDIVLTRSEGNVGRLVLNRPERGNALNDEIVERLGTAFDTLVADGARMIVLTGNGRHFCTGFDLSDIDELRDGDLLLRFARIEMLLQKLHSAPVTTMAIAQGRTAGAGADIFASLDHRIAIAGASFAFPGVGFGLILGTTRLAERVGRDAARAILLSGSTLSDTQAVENGLASEASDEAGIEALVEAKADAAGRLETTTVADIHHATSRHGYDSDLANLIKSASRSGLRDRIIRYRDSVRKAASNRS